MPMGILNVPLFHSTVPTGSPPAARAAVFAAAVVLPPAAALFTSLGAVVGKSFESPISLKNSTLYSLVTVIFLLTSLRLTK